VKRIELQEWERTPEVIAAKVEAYSEKLKAYRASVTLSIPGDMVLFQTAEFPSVVETNLKDVISFEFNRLTPFTANQAYYDYEVIESREQRLRVSLSVALNEPIDGFMHAFSRKNLKIEKVTVNSLGLANVISGQSKMPDYLFIAPYKNDFEGGLISGEASCTLSRVSLTGEKKKRLLRQKSIRS